MSGSDQQWKTSPSDPRLAKNEVHIWRAFLNVEVSVLCSLQRTLTEEEVTKAKRFYFEKDRHHFIVAHGILRTLLGRYLKTDPSLLRFDYNSYGKPSLDCPFNERKLHFNLSHSHEVALYAFTYARQVGVDVEYMRLDIEYEQLARHSFSSNEQAALHALRLTHFCGAPKQRDYNGCCSKATGLTYSSEECRRTRL
jgi:4'-phosphopantetheinyl transferase